MKRLLVLLAACGPPAVLGPISASEIKNNDDLITYLAQRDASAAVCDVHSTVSAHVKEVTPVARHMIVTSTKIRDDVWAQCIASFASALEGDARAALYDDLLDAYAIAIGSGIDRSPALVDRATNILQMYTDRPFGFDPHPAHVASALARANRVRRQGPIAERFADDLFAAVMLDDGLWQGRPVDASQLDELAAAGNETTLRRFVKRLPAPELRDQAKERIVALHVARSPFPELRAESRAALVARVLSTGHNAVAAKVVRTWFDPDHVVTRDVVVDQDVWQRKARLTADAGGQRSIVPELPLRGALFAEATGISHPITVCAPRDDFDPSPCLDPQALAVDQPLAHLDGRGVVHVNDNLSIEDVLPLADLHGFQIGIVFDHHVIASLAWGLDFAPPDDMVFEDGPNLRVNAGDTRGARVRFDTNYGGRDYVAVLERDDLSQFHVVSRGRAGWSGSDGAKGSTGSTGSECQNGHDGGRGGDGGDGGHGGDGGNIAVSLDCAFESCAVLKAQVVGSIVSEGGPGGRGGRGGAGGDGGMGGSSRSARTHVDASGHTVTDDAGCSGGASGHSGSSGMDGHSGWPGKPGVVSY
ncbi:MAG: hypothetical protein QM831_40420 [Kofleriaceae bacterium]